MPQEFVSLERRGNVAVITIDNPPVNAISPGVPSAVIAALAGLAEDALVQGVVLAAAGKGGIAGADIRWQGKAWPVNEPRLSGMIAALSAFPKPTLALVRGNALGGGLEIALACGLRVATAGTRLGQPEVTLGIPPGAGGTQRLPRVVGVERAIDMIVSGKPIPARDALEVGLLDRIVPDDAPLDAAIAWLRELLLTGDDIIATDHRAIPDFDPDTFARWRETAAKTWRGQTAPLVCIDCVEAATRLPLADGLAFERARFEDCVASPQAAALRHVFVAERAAQKVPGLDPAAARAVATVGIVGAGTMGTGIAIASANAGYSVRIVDRTTEMLDGARARIADSFGGQVAKGRLSREEADRRIGLVGFDVGIGHLADVDLVIEAAFEDLDVKRRIFEDLARHTRNGTVLASNTSYLDLDQIAEAAGERSKDVVGLHFFSPANIMPLLEIVRGQLSSDAALATAVETGKRLRKTAIVSGVCPGFIANRTFEKYTREAEFLLQEGATPAQVDGALVAFGMPMGPFAVRDLAGLDIGWARRKSVAHLRKPAERYSRVGDEICERGWFGQKTGKGFYLYDKGSRTPTPNPEVEEIVLATAAQDGIERRDISNEEIVERCFFQVVNEAARVLEEGVALRASDVDLAWIAGYGFPRWRGGPLYWASEIGLPKVLDRVRTYDTTNDFWSPAPLLVQLAGAGKGFGDFEGARA